MSGAREILSLRGAHTSATQRWVGLHDVACSTRPRFHLRTIAQRELACTGAACVQAHDIAIKHSRWQDSEEGRSLHTTVCFARPPNIGFILRKLRCRQSLLREDYYWS